MMSGTTDLMREIKILKSMNERLNVRKAHLEAINDDLRKQLRECKELQKKEIP